MLAAIAIGNALRGDDNVANLVLGRLKPDKGLAILKGPPEDLISPLRELSPKKLFIIDALDFGAEPGSVRAFGIADVETPRPSTHSIPAELLKRFLPRTEVVIIGIQPGNTGYSTELSPRLAARLDAIAKEVSRIIR